MCACVPKSMPFQIVHQHLFSMSQRFVALLLFVQRAQGTHFACAFIFAHYIVS